MKPIKTLREKKPKTMDEATGVTVPREKLHRFVESALDSDASGRPEGSLGKIAMEFKAMIAAAEGK